MEMTIEQFCALVDISEDQFTGKEKIIQWEGNDDFDLSEFTEIPDGFSPHVVGNLNMENVLTIPKGFNPVVEGCLWLSSVTMIPENFAPTVYSLALSSITTLPKGFNPVGCSTMYLNRVTSIEGEFSFKLKGSLNVESLVAIPERFNPEVGGCLTLGGFPDSMSYIPKTKNLKLMSTTIPENFNLIVEGNLYLDNLKTIPKGFKPIVGQNLSLRGLIEIPNDFHPIVFGNIYMNNVTSVPDNFNLIVGGSLYMDNLVSIPKNFSPVVGGFLSLDSVDVIPEDFNPSMSGTAVGLCKKLTVPMRVITKRNRWRGNVVAEQLNIIKKQIIWK